MLRRAFSNVTVLFVLVSAMALTIGLSARLWATTCHIVRSQNNLTTCCNLCCGCGGACGFLCNVGTVCHPILGKFQGEKLIPICYPQCLVSSCRQHCFGNKSYPCATSKFYIAVICKHCCGQQCQSTVFKCGPSTSVCGCN